MNLKPKLLTNLYSNHFRLNVFTTAKLYKTDFDIYFISRSLIALDCCYKCRLNLVTIF